MQCIDLEYVERHGHETKQETSCELPPKQEWVGDKYRGRTDGALQQALAERFKGNEQKVWSKLGTGVFTHDYETTDPGSCIPVTNPVRDEDVSGCLLHREFIEDTYDVRRNVKDPKKAEDKSG